MTGKSKMAICLLFAGCVPALSGAVFAQPINPVTSEGGYTGGGVTLTAADLRRIADRDNALGSPRGGGAGNVLLVECNGAYGYGTIQGAIDAAVDGDVVVVLPTDCAPDGHWHENIDFHGKAIRVQSANPADVAIVDATVLDGSAMGSVVRFVSGEGADSELDGLTLTNGLAVGGQIPGGGVTCNMATPTIRRCTIHGNHGSQASAISAVQCDELRVDSCRIYGNLGGGAILCYLTRSLHVVNSVISHVGSSSVRFAPLGVTDCAPSEVCSVFDSCQFSDSHVGTLVDGASMFFSGCEFTQNEGALISGSAVSIEDCQFEGNISGSYGIRAMNAAAVLRSRFTENTYAGPSLIQSGPNQSLTVEDCQFEANESHGGALVYGGGSCRVSRNSFTDNFRCGGLVYIASSLDSRIDYCTFVGNTDLVGGVIYASGSPFSTKIRHCSLIGNSCNGAGAIRTIGAEISDCLVVGNTAGGYAGGINGSQSTVKRCTIVGNRAQSSAGGVLFADISNSILFDNRIVGNQGQVHRQVAQVSGIRFCDVENLYSSYLQLSEPQFVGNFDMLPRFVDPGHWDEMGTPSDFSDDIFVPGDYHLLAESPCIDRGEPGFVPESDAVDFDGEPRLISCRVDMGVDEFTQDEISVPGDFDGDGVVTIDDVPAFLVVTLDPIGLGVCRADLNGDGFADGRDVAAMAALLLGS